MSIQPDKGYRCDLCRAIGGVQACRYEGDPAVDNSVGCANCKTNKVECSFLHEVGWRHQPKGKEVYIAPAEVLFRPLRRKRKAAALDGGGDGNGNGSGKEEERWFAFDGEDKAFLKPTQEEPSDTQLALMRLRSGAPPSSSSPKQTTTTARRPSKSPTASASSSTSKRPKPSSSTTNRLVLALELDFRPGKQPPRPFSLRNLAQSYYRHHSHQDQHRQQLRHQAEPDNRLQPLPHPSSGLRTRTGCAGARTCAINRPRPTPTNQRSTAT
ncbi:unnamed protein product [Tilletia controversa]|nr:unnamed protein product [Tilletia controversa]